MDSFGMSLEEPWQGGRGYRWQQKVAASVGGFPAIDRFSPRQGHEQILAHSCPLRPLPLSQGLLQLSQGY